MVRVCARGDGTAVDLGIDAEGRGHWVDTDDLSLDSGVEGSPAEVEHLLIGCPGAPKFPECPARTWGAQSHGGFDARC